MGLVLDGIPVLPNGRWVIVKELVDRFVSNFWILVLRFDFPVG